MKLTKENVYIKLQGKSKWELTELYWLLKNNNEKLFHNDLSVFIEEYYKTNRFLEYYNQRWGGGDNLKTEVTIEQLKEILKPMESEEFKKGDTIIITDFGGINSTSFTLNKPYKLKEDFVKGETDFIVYKDDKGSKGNGYFLKSAEKLTIEQYKETSQPMENREEQLRKEAIERGFVNGVEFFGSQGVESDKPMLICDNIRYAEPNEDIGIWGLYVNDSWLCYNGTWGTLAEETLEQQLQKAEAEVKRLKEAIEDSKIKVGDWCKFWDVDKDKFIIGKYQEKYGGCHITSDFNFINYEKITDLVLIESLNKLF